MNFFKRYLLLGIMEIVLFVGILLISNDIAQLVLGIVLCAAFVFLAVLTSKKPSYTGREGIITTVERSEKETRYKVRVVVDDEPVQLVTPAYLNKYSVKADVGEKRAVGVYKGYNGENKIIMLDKGFVLPAAKYRVLFIVGAAVSACIGLLGVLGVTGVFSLGELYENIMEKIL